MAQLFHRIIMLGSAIVAISAPAYAQDCELHIWPTAEYGGVYFHAANIQYSGYGTSYDLVDTVLPTVGAKAHAAFGPNQQSSVLSDAIKNSGKFAGYKIVAHDPLPQEQSAKYANLLSNSVGTGSREIPVSAPCYAEMHVTYITAFKTAMSKMLMTGFVVRYFPETPTEGSIKVIHSKPQRGEERIGLSHFDFSTTTLKPEEGPALSEAFKYMADRFLRKKVK